MTGATTEPEAVAPVAWAILLGVDDVEPGMAGSVASRLLSDWSV
jgi:hypothetical protein